MIQMLWTSDMLINIYQSTRCYNPEDSHLRIIIRISNHTFDNYLKNKQNRIISLHCFLVSELTASGKVTIGT
jgi:hypothetical protein